MIERLQQVAALGAKITVEAQAGRAANESQRDCIIQPRVEPSAVSSRRFYPGTPCERFINPESGCVTSCHWLTTVTEDATLAG
jgi:hypothetical protein